MNPPAANLATRTEIQCVLLLSMLATLHVFVFTAAFPFFNCVDEQMHFDLVVRYAQGQVPRQLEPVSPEAIRYIAMFSSRAYLTDPASLPEGKLPAPLWRQSSELALPQLGERAAQWANITNAESSMPPLYYAIAGTWWNVGKLIAIHGERLLYWLRFLNPLIVAAVVWLGWFTARRMFPNNIFVRLAVPALIAFMPSTALYSINSDILTPLVFGAAFLLLLKFWEAKMPTPRLAAVTGLALAATFLTKISTLPLLATSALFVASKLVQLVRQRKLRAALPSLAILSACAALPILGWMSWCKTNYGDFTGSAIKIQILGWADQPMANWLAHPLFTLRGFWIFIRDTLATFWQGEFLWMRQPLASQPLNVFYAVLTITLLTLALIVACKRPSVANRAALGFAFASLAATFAFYALLSVKFDFQECFYPSRTHPFFTSGRLFLGLLIPILILCASGLDFALQKFTMKTKFSLLAALLLFMLTGEVVVDWPVFACEYNWFHLG